MHFKPVYTGNNKLKLTFILIVYFFACYFFSGYFYLGKPWEIPLTAVDEFFMFSPGFIFIYFSSYIYPLSIFILGKDPNWINRFIISFVILVAISTLIFFLFPTIIPRHAYPVVGDLNPLTEFSMMLIRTMDVSNNCLPSLHVSSSVLITAFYFHDGDDSKWFKGCKKYFIPSLIWSLLIIISTMTTKQHYFWDCVGGVFTALLVYFGIFRRMQFNTK